MNLKKIWIFFTALLILSFALLISLDQNKATKGKDSTWELSGNCTSVTVTKEASVDGSVMTTHSCDGGYEFRLHVVPGETHESGEMRPVYKGGGHGAERDPAVKVGEIPEVKKTYSRFDIAYPFMNEKQLAIGETTFGGRRKLYNPQGMWDIMALQRVALERASTAREAIQLMGRLVDKYGYGDKGECLTICDTKEAWVFEVLGAGPLQKGAVWAARRVPDGEVFVSANRSRIGELDLEDKDNCMASDNVVELAQKNGWYDPDSSKPFKFNKAYDPSESIGSRRREWRVLSTLAPELNLDPWSVDYPFSVKPEKKVSVEQLKSFHRDYYQGTPFDLSEGMAAGPFGNPNRFATWGKRPEGYIGWERPISIFRCSYCFVSQSRDWLPDWVGGLAWFALDDPKTSCFVPLYCGITTVPQSYQIGRRDEFNRNSAWWAFDFVSNWSNLKYSHMIKDIQKAYKDFEATFSNLQPAVEKRAQSLYKENPPACREYLTEYCNDMAQKVVSDWWKLADYLIMKYNDGYINTPEGRKAVGYPDWWLDEVGYGETKIKNK